MAVTLRWYQEEIKAGVYTAWQSGKRRVLAVAPTGAGKTATMGRVAAEYNGVGVIIAHRQELLSQISTAFARESVPHVLHSNGALRRVVRAAHIAETGRQWVDSNARWHIVGVDTLVKMKDEPWMQQVGLIMQDEAHHVLKLNKWGKAWARFREEAYGLGVTATPGRADGKGLGSHADGLFDEMVERVPMRTLIEQGYLTDYDVVAPDATDLGLDDIEVSTTTGDYNADQLRKHFQQNTKIIGDVVNHYLKFARGKLGVTFAVDIESAGKIAAEFRANGIAAEVLSGKTPDQLRQSLLNRFKNGEFQQLVSVDILGEGFDLPAIEVVSFARPTASLPLFIQQAGRVLRLMVEREHLARWEDYTIEQRLAVIASSRKPKALIIDHVGNFMRHKAPDKARVWTLDRRDKRAKKIATDDIPLRTCLNPECLKPYARDLLACPSCGMQPPAPTDRSGPDEVDGDLVLLDPAKLAELRGLAEAIHQPAPIQSWLPAMAQRANLQRHHERIELQNELRHVIALWAGKWGHQPDQVNYRRFYLTFGLDVLTACGEREHAKIRTLIQRIQENLAL